MSIDPLSLVSQELQIPPNQVRAAAKLLAEGATVPFIARYRKEVTGSLDEVAIAAIRDRFEQISALNQRRDTILKSLDERKLLTDALKTSILEAVTLSRLEDLYQPFKPKVRTRAMIARERGLEPLADQIWNEQETLQDLNAAATLFIDAEKEVPDLETAFAGARDILAERMNDDAGARAAMRSLFQEKGIIRSRVLTGKETEAAKFKDYFEWSEPAAKAPSHRILAMRRGEQEGFLIVRIQPEESDGIAILEARFAKGKTPATEQVRLAAKDCYKRLIGLSMETETRMQLKKRADEEAIRVFTENLRELLMAAPLGRRNVLAIDPGFRTGCKVVCLDSQGKLLHHDVVYPEMGSSRAEEAARKLKGFCEHFKVNAIAVGNGTAGRETEAFLRTLKLPAQIVAVNESGASIYSASDIAREEFPDHDLTVRGAVSIGRRLMDPLAELVKLDPKSIGVGQYQHDVDQNALKRSLDDTVVHCVNKVGVELNTASAPLLAYVSGLNSNTAKSIVAHRDEHGPFKNREELLKVPRLGPKAFEQAAGFLRIRESEHPLDGSAVHPERYELVSKMAGDVGCSIHDLLREKAFRSKIDPARYVTENVGMPTLKDILEELEKPGRDPREQFEIFSFSEAVHKPEDLQPGMKLPGIVTNVTAFGAFVDIGVHQDGLVHISQLSDQFVKDPADVVKVAQKVEVTVMEIDLVRKRIALSMKSRPDRDAQTGTRSSPGTRDASRGNAGSGNRNSGARDNARPPQTDWFTAAMNKK